MSTTQEHQIIADLAKETAQKNIVASFLLHKEKSHLMRIGNNSVSLNTSENLTRFIVEVINGRRVGVHTQMGKLTSIEYARKALQIAIEKAKVANEKDYQPIQVEIEDNFCETDQYDKALATLDPSFKADAYARIIKELGDHYNFSGSWSSGTTELFLMSTANDKQLYHKGTDQDFNVVLKHPQKKWELRDRQNGWKFLDFSVEQVIKNINVLLPTYENQQPFKPEPGKYKVAFGSEAIAEVMMMGAYVGLSGRAWEEKLGWTSKNQIGDKILGSNFSLIDDPTNDSTYRFGFDLSGKLRKPYQLIENGIFKNLMYDSTSAAKYNHSLTGHSTSSLSLVFPAGTDPDCLLQASKGEGKILYIPALHYINLPSYSKGIFTGSSRFNALLIEEGKIISPIFSSRVTDTFQKIFSNIIKTSSKADSINLSSTYDRREPRGFSAPSYIIVNDVNITDSSNSF